MWLGSKRPILLEPCRTKLHMVLGRRRDRTTFAVLLTAKTCSQTEEEHHFYHCHAREDVLQSNSCHVVRLVVEEAELVAPEKLKV